MDGIEVLAVIFAKRLSLTVGTFVMIYNVVLYIICGIIYQSWILPLYSIVTYIVALKVIDYIVEGFDRSKSAMIITTKHNEICEKLSVEFENGITFLTQRLLFRQRQNRDLFCAQPLSNRQNARNCSLNRPGGVHFDNRCGRHFRRKAEKGIIRPRLQT